MTATKPTETSPTDTGAIPKITHAEAMELQATEFEHALAMLRGLTPEQ